MRVIIDFEGTGSAPWSGRIRFGAASAPSTRFEGRLHLLRFLEDAVEHADERTNSDGSNL